MTAPSQPSQPSQPGRSRRRVTRTSRRLSWLLRHGAGEAGLAMDAAGWAAVADVLATLGISAGELRRAVDENDKGRLQLDGDRVRACQGHSLRDMPVTCAALEASGERITPATPLWHGTTVAALAGIGRHGLDPQARTHVHLAMAPDSRVGKRASVEVLLEVDPAVLARRGLGVFRSPNGVLLVRRVPPAAIAATHPVGVPAERVERACAAAGLPFGGDADTAGT